MQHIEFIYSTHLIKLKKNEKEDRKNTHNISKLLVRFCIEYFFQAAKKKELNQYLKKNLKIGPFFLNINSSMILYVYTMGLQQKSVNYSLHYFEKLNKIVKTAKPLIIVFHVSF